MGSMVFQARFTLTILKVKPSGVNLLRPLYSILSQTY